MEIVNEVLHPDTADIISQIVIVLLGLLVRFFEKKKDKQKEN